MPQVNINTTIEHVAEIEQRIKVIKERCRATISTLPFKRLQNIMTMNLVHFSVFWLNEMSVKAGISTVFSPRELYVIKKLMQKNGASCLLESMLRLMKNPQSKIQCRQDLDQ